MTRAGGSQLVFRAPTSSPTVGYPTEGVGGKGWVCKPVPGDATGNAVAYAEAKIPGTAAHVDGYRSVSQLVSEGVHSMPPARARLQVGGNKHTRTSQGDTEHSFRPKQGDQTRTHLHEPSA